MLKKKALLYVTSVVPWPINRGAAHRTDQVLRALLDQQLAVDLICLNQSEPKSSSASIVARLRKQYPKLRHVTVRRHPNFIKNWRSSDAPHRLRYHAARAWEAATWRAGTINSAQHCPPNLEKLVRAKLSGTAYDIAWFNYLRVIPRGLSTNATVICDLHDYQTERIRADVLPTLHRWRRSYYLRHFFESERAALNLCDRVVAISPIEADRISVEMKPRQQIVCIPATDDPRSIGSKTSEFDLLYVGSRSDANVAGIKWFLEQCFPGIVAEIPLVKLLIQGTIINAPYLKGGPSTLKHGTNITLSGPVEDLASIYSSAKLVICPVLHGTGMKIKMVEAMAYGQAIVATSKAAEGIATDLGLQTHDDTGEFSAACVETLIDPGALERRRLVSRAIFERDHAHTQLASKLRALLEQERSELPDAGITGPAGNIVGDTVIG